MRRPVDPAHLTDGSAIAIARAITQVENEGPESESLLRAIFPKTGRCRRIGITGPPGAGKSTLTNRLARGYRERGLTVGIIAVDPTSPFTGGALLGDRVRMSDVELDPGVFIRSMGSRGSLGGLSRRTNEAVDVLDAAGMDVVLMETVGVGQSELDIAGAADTTVVVLVPESGDSIQAMKAGLMEIADVFVLNKSDRPGADQAVMSIETILHFRQKQAWTPPVVKTIASDGTGIDAVRDMIDEHQRTIAERGTLAARRALRVEHRVRELIELRLHDTFWTSDRIGELRSLLPEILDRRLTPYDAAEQLMRSLILP
jgi:LAO/AO transport system kinase